MVSVDRFWGDVMAEEIIARVEAEPKLKKVVAENGYFIYDEKTPSGEIHIGSGRGWVIHDVLAKCLRKLGVKARFILSSDDYDPFDKPIKGKPEYDKYLGMPFKNIPSPVEGYESWADYYFSQVTEKFDIWGIDAEFESTGEEYIKGTFDAAIKTCLDKHKQIAAIFERIYDKPYDRIPFNPICEKCGKIGTTLTTSWDSEKELITYECRNDVVEWADGCGHKGQMSPYKGSGKLPWKVEWAAKWPSKGVIVETAGKDHFTKGGSRTVSIAICNEVLEYPPPYPSTATTEGPGYEFVNIGGRKMSTSKGMGVGFAQMSDHIPAHILRYLMVSYKPYSVIDFDPSRSNDLLLLYDRYDTTERIYYGEEAKRAEELKRVYELSYVGKIPEKQPVQVSLRNAGVIVQIARDDEHALELLERQGITIPEQDRSHVFRRFNSARMWLAEFAPESEKFTVQTSVNAEAVAGLTDIQKKAISIVSQKLTEKRFNEQELFEEFYTICENLELKNTEFFKGMYTIILNKPRGPKLANLILTIGQEEVAQLLAGVR